MADWITDLTNSTGAKYYQQKRAAEDRNIRQGIIVNLALTSLVSKTIIQIAGDNISIKIMTINLNRV